MTSSLALQRIFLGRLGFGRLVEIFLVSAVASVLGIRFFLAATGYPQIGGGGLHVAHVMFGGMGMLVAMIMVMAFLSHTSLIIAMVVGGLGFGAFIDEIGKFVTSDNDYFFRPAVAMMYLLFLGIFALARIMEARIRPSPEVYLANAMEIAKESAVRDLDVEEEQRALQYLRHCDPQAPPVRALHALFEWIEAKPVDPPGRPERFLRMLHDRYAALVQHPAFRAVIVGVFSLGAMVVLVQAYITIGRDGEGSGFADWGMAISATAVAGLVLIGLATLRYSRLTAYHWFLRASLISIFVAQFFAFYRIQFSALIGLLLSVVVWAALTYAIREEETSELPATPEVRE